MAQHHTTTALSPPPTSPMVLSDALLTLARDADRAGFLVTADRLVVLAHRVFDETLPLAQDPR